MSQFEAHIRSILGFPILQSHTKLKVPYAAMLNLLGNNPDEPDYLDAAKLALVTPGASVHLYGKEEPRPGRKMGHITIVADTQGECQARTNELVLEGSFSSALSPLVGVIMGSDSDLSTMYPASNVLDELGVPHEVRIISAHRTPKEMLQYASDARKRGLKVIIAGAGGAAHLPGMIAAATTLPVIGVPVKGKVLDGVDSLYSIVQMPRGVPVATVAINSSTNAALLAVRMLSVQIAKYRYSLEEYAESTRNVVQEKDRELTTVGPKAYLDSMPK